jgi:hypothetical protein
LSTNTANGLPYPALSDANNPPADLQALGLAVDARYGLTVATVSALTGISTPFTGMTVWVTTPGDLYVYNGTTWEPTGLAGWQTYTPTITASTNPNLGSGGSITGRYLQIGKTVFYDITVTWGTTSLSAGTGAYALSLPVAMKAGFAMPVGNGAVFDSSATAFQPRTAINIGGTGSTSIGLVNDAGTRVGPAAPYTWANGDTIQAAGMYEAA